MPPLSRLVKLQLVLLAVVGLLATTYAGFRYVRLGESVGSSHYRVTLQMDDGAGIFPDAQVTYNGVPAGRVADMELTDDGMETVLSLRKDVGPIPASATAVIANRSAIGEQFVDLRPKDSKGPYLRDGSRIDAIQVPPELTSVLNDVIALTESVPHDDLQTVVTELGKAFNGRADDLSRLLDSVTELAETGHDNLGETIALLKDSDTVLATQAEQSDEILEWSKGIDDVAATLASSDPALRRTLTDGPRAAGELSGFLDQHGDDTTKLVHQLGETIHHIEPATYSVGQTFYMLSSLSAGSHTTAGNDGQIHFGIVLETNNPPACTQGYQSTQRMIAEYKKTHPDFDINYDDFPFNREAECTVPVGNPTAVRGARRAALANPTIPQPWDDVPKKDADKLNLNPIATQLSWLMGVEPR